MNDGSNTALAIGLALGLIAGLATAGGVTCNTHERIEKRTIEMGKATYKDDLLVYTDPAVEYIFTGKKIPAENK